MWVYPVKGKTEFVNINSNLRISNRLVGMYSKNRLSPLLLIQTKNKVLNLDTYDIKNFFF